jgi:DNA mismatch repair protein MutS2
MRRQALAEEMRQILISEREAPTEEFYDIAEIVEKARVEGTFLEVMEVVQLGKALISAGDFVQFLHKSNAELYPTLTTLAKPVRALWNIVADIRRIIDESNTVRDGASEELRQIRAQIRRHEGQVSKRLHAILQSAKSSGIVESDASISIRDGRAVIPVSAANKRKLSGFIHDESATGKTFYVEPAEVVELNNMLRELEYEERREIVRILTAFTDVVRADIDDVERTEEFMAVVDMVRAKARWAIENGAGRPILAEDDRLVLHTAKHPLLSQSLKRQKRTIIPLDAELDESKRILVISGPNAGGKSVCLKTIGLLQYMFQCGYPITASEASELPVFNRYI